MLNNPTPMIYQNLKLSMESDKENVQVPEKGGLLGPKRPMRKSAGQDIANPVNRVASYVKLIQQKREELKNG